MGEAKRRKTAGTYPKEGSRAEEFRVPEGMIAITFDIEGSDPSTFAVETRVITECLAGIILSLQSHLRALRKTHRIDILRFISFRRRLRPVYMRVSR